MTTSFRKSMGGVKLALALVISLLLCAVASAEGWMITHTCNTPGERQQETGFEALVSGTYRYRCTTSGAWAYMACNMYVNGEGWQQPCNAWGNQTYCYAKYLSAGATGYFNSNCDIDQQGCTAQANLWSPDYHKPPYCPDIPDGMER